MPYFYAAVAVLAIGAGSAQAKEQQEQRKYEKKAQRQKTAMQVEQNRRAAVQTIRQARIKRAAIEQMAVNSGARGSGEQGALGSISSQTGSSVGFQNVQSQAALNTSNFLAQASRAEGRAATAGAIKDSALSVMGMASGGLGG